MKILLAEDEIALSRAYATALEMQGYEVVQAFDGERALELANNEVFNLMIFDIMMPKKSGLEVLKELRASGNTTYVIMLTAMSEVDDKISASALNMIYKSIHNLHHIHHPLTIHDCIYTRLTTFYSYFS